MTTVKWVSSETEWDLRKTQIRELYLDDDQPLKDVMAIMLRARAFRASIETYKSHIIKWGFDKKNKESEVLAIVRKKIERERMGKATEFFLRGRPYDFEDAERYLKRRKIAIRDVLERPPPSPPTLRCSTPEVLLSPGAPAVFGLPSRILTHITAGMELCPS